MERRKGTPRRTSIGEPACPRRRSPILGARHFGPYKATARIIILIQYYDLLFWTLSGPDSTKMKCLPLHWPTSYWNPPEPPGRDIKTAEQRETQITTIIDRHGFNVRVFLVAASGFFTDSYNLFATNVIAPSLAYVYWNDAKKASHEQTINAATLGGSLVGMLLFGHLCDRYGRRNLYGIELLIVIGASMGMAQSSSGYRTCSNPSQESTCETSMNAFRWMIFWRVLLGIGIGAEYPLSAIISAEWSSRKSRARMLAAVFLMQPCGQLMAYLVGLAALRKIPRYHPNLGEKDAARLVIDSVWRCVIGVGAIPALLAIVARLSIPETPRYTLLIEQNDSQARRDAVKVYGFRESIGSPEQAFPRSPKSPGGQFSTTFDQKSLTRESNRASGNDVIESAHGLRINGLVLPQSRMDDAPSPTTSPPMNRLDANGQSVKKNKSKLPRRRTRGRDRRRIQQFTWPKIYQYFIREGNWRFLAATSLCWMLLDVGFYGLGLNNPRIVSRIWMSKSAGGTELPVWNSDFVMGANATIYDVLEDDADRLIATISTGSLVGSILFLVFVNHIPRSRYLVWSFLGLAALFAITGGIFFKAYQTSLYRLTITLYVLIQMLFNLGPNTLTFILPSEIFSTPYRGTCYGVAAAAGKAGSIIGIYLLRSTHISEANARPEDFAGLLIGVGGMMLLGAFFAWIWIPDVQDGRSLPVASDSEAQQGRRRSCASWSDRWKRPSKSLEALAQGMEGVRKDEGQLIGLRNKVKRVLR